MRDVYLFRGQRVDNGEWEYGWPLTNKLGAYIITEKNPLECTQYGYIEIDEYARVIPETVGPYIGRDDKNNKKAFKGDIVKLTDTIIGEVIYSNGSYYVNGAPIADFETLEVIGNIYEDGEQYV